MQAVDSLELMTLSTQNSTTLTNFNRCAAYFRDHCLPVTLHLRCYRIVTHRLKTDFQDVQPAQPEACSICMDMMTVSFVDVDMMAVSFLWA